jgi:hypothetical protein
MQLLHGCQSACYVTLHILELLSEREESVKLHVLKKNITETPV